MILYYIILALVVALGVSLGLSFLNVNVKEKIGGFKQWLLDKKLKILGDVGLRHKVLFGVILIIFLAMSAVNLYIFKQIIVDNNQIFLVIVK
jgi:hypothetical protein